MAANPLVIEVATDVAGGERLSVSGHNTIAAVLSDGVQAWAVVDGTRLPLHLLPVWRQCESFRNAVRIEWAAKLGGKLLVALAQDTEVQRGILLGEGTEPAGSDPHLVQTASGLLLLDDFTVKPDGPVVGYSEVLSTFAKSRFKDDPAPTFAQTYRIKGGRLEILGTVAPEYHLIRNGLDMLAGVVQVVADRPLGSPGVGALARYVERSAFDVHAFLAFTSESGGDDVNARASVWENDKATTTGNGIGPLPAQPVTVKAVLNGALGKAGGEVVGHYYLPSGATQNISATVPHASGRVGLVGHGSGGKIRSLSAYKGNSVRVEGLPAGAEIRIGSLRVRENSGVAVVDLGNTPCPLPRIDVVQGWAVTSSLTPLDGVWGGDVYELRT